MLPLVQAMGQPIAAQGARAGRVGGVAQLFLADSLGADHLGRAKAGAATSLLGNGLVARQGSRDGWTAGPPSKSR